MQGVMMLKSLFNSNLVFILAALLGLGTGFLEIGFLEALASAVSEVFINLLKLVSLPIIFLSIVSTASSMESISEIKNLGKKVIKYTLLTTVTAAALALALFVGIDPVRSVAVAHSTVGETLPQPSYLNYLIHIIPSNIVQPFSENQVVGVLFLAMLLSLAILSLPAHNRGVLHHFFSSLYMAIMKITTWIVRLMPLGVWAFVALFVRDFKHGLDVESLALYLTVVLLANLIQAGVILPLFLQWKGISAIALFRSMFPALSVAFFTKSSSAALPMAIKCAQERAGVENRIASFTLPLCTTINMNACAAFILTTVLFVSMSQGMVYSPLEMGVWIFIATVAAVGNAGVPMGCYFLSSAFLAAMNVPLNILGVILPFYAMIDMLESAINVWSDSCVTAIVNKEICGEDALKNTLASLPENDSTQALPTRGCC
jgi:Na+/H+-dicarboxylate symporter